MAFRQQPWPASMPAVPIGNADHVAEYGGVNRRRRSWVQAYHDQPQWIMAPARKARLSRRLRCACLLAH